MNRAKQILTLAVLAAAAANVGCGQGDYIPLAKVEAPKDGAAGAAPKKPAKAAGSPTKLIYQ